MCWQMKAICQFILELTSKRIQTKCFNYCKLYLVEKILTRVGITVSASLKCREMPTGKLFLHKQKSSLGRKCVWNYREAVDMLSYLHGSTWPEISMYLHQCANFKMICVLWMITLSDALQITSLSSLHIQIYWVLIYDYLQAEQFTGPIKKKA